jgi:protein phosphatase
MSNHGYRRQTMQIQNLSYILIKQSIILPSAFFASPLKPLTQSDWIWLAGSGLGLGIVVILLAIILALLFVVKRRRKKALAKNNQAQSLPSADSPTLTSARPVVGVSSDDDPTKPSVSLDEDAGDTKPIALEPEAGQAAITPSEARPPNIGWRIAGLTHVGLKRKLNEDKLLILEASLNEGQPYGLYIVADGMGGHEHGEVASQLTIDTIQARFAQLVNEAAPYEEWFRRTIVAANETVIAHQADKEMMRKMGSTLVMALITSDNKAYITHVGDSRAYHLTNNSMTQITEDHSLVERLIQIGQITREEARTHKQRNVIYSTIGDKNKLQIGLYNVDLQPGDRLLLCSDGLTGMLTDDQILNINRSYASPAETCQVLVKAANAAGGEDNITTVLIEMDA